MDLFGIGPLELILILVLAFILLGPDKMGDMAKGLGKTLREVQRSMSEVSRVLEDEPAKPAVPEAKETSAGGSPAKDGISQTVSATGESPASDDKADQPPAPKPEDKR